MRYYLAITHTVPHARTHMHTRAYLTSFRSGNALVSGLQVSSHSHVTTHARLSQRHVPAVCAATGARGLVSWAGAIPTDAFGELSCLRPVRLGARIMLHLVPRSLAHLVRPARRGPTEGALDTWRARVPRACTMQHTAAAGAGPETFGDPDAFGGGGGRRFDQRGLPETGAWTVVVCGRDHAASEEMQSGVRAVWRQLAALGSPAPGSSGLAAGGLLLPGGGCGEVHVGRYLEMRASLALGCLAAGARGRHAQAEAELEAATEAAEASESADGASARSRPGLSAVEWDRCVRRVTGDKGLVAGIAFPDEQRRVLRAVRVIGHLVAGLAAFLTGPGARSCESAEAVDRLREANAASLAAQDACVRAALMPDAPRGGEVPWGATDGSRGRASGVAEEAGVAAAADAAAAGGGAAFYGWSGARGRPVCVWQRGSSSRLPRFCTSRGGDGERVGGRDGGMGDEGRGVDAWLTGWGAEGECEVLESFADKLKGIDASLACAAAVTKPRYVLPSPLAPCKT